MKKLMVIILLILSSCQVNPNYQGFEEETKSDFQDKKVVMIIVDTMMGSLINSSAEKNNIPALEFLMNEGQYYNDLVAPFPTMSVTIESTLLTGEMADEHHIPGLSWYSQSEDRIINYGTSVPTLLRLGLSESVYDALYHLNNTHLNPSSKTIFEELDEENLTSGAINTIVYRGNHLRELELPFITDDVLGLPETIETRAPETFAFGKLSIPNSIDEGNFTDDIFHRYGLNDEFSMEIMKKLIKQGDQPDFTLIFFPDFDKTAHKHSPHYRVGFEEVDKYLQGILNAYDSWEDALEENIFIVLGDHGQDKLLEDEESLTINLPELYGNYETVPLGEEMSQGEIAFGINQRMTYVYDIHNNGILRELAEQAVMDERIAMAAWLDDENDDWVSVSSSNDGNVLSFKRGGEWSDRYDQTWSIIGDPDVVSINMNHEKNEISYINYPDVFNQLYTSLKSHETPKLILAAEPGYSFWEEGIPTHPDGGEHGGIHKNDTLAALIIAGTDKKPEKFRMMDLKNYVLNLLIEDPEKKSLKGTAVKQGVTDEQTHDEVLRLVDSIEGVTESVAIVVDEYIYTAFKVKHFDRLWLKDRRQQAQELLDNNFNNYNVKVSTDSKIFTELANLAEKRKDNGLTNEDVKKEVKEIEANM
ncbi:alkaline phosphatase family protein [Evansella cellulosilytica]|uniref:Type I phosphodiesterase/nucleotide pyrophosphatase n=1 Tax=Evansella cellulosilytica (strain ATCC 21833 / DSM 2522 / FERM P-1141 / JCM 9156 / N-4) TaxID=649639 RepID=E6TW64_EVAC2|nr:alkaline phosphatase family protein [Evansella cellulosilytica]ADU31020.1 type I phosphodiesterase/nucleotide pyrophosphatase [Evansella cellulosilytica DSM 2522]